jgi:hypothetical protein
MTMSAIDEMAERILAALLNGPMMYRGQLPEDGQALDLIRHRIAPIHERLEEAERRVERLRELLRMPASILGIPDFMALEREGE